MTTLNYKMTSEEEDDPVQKLHLKKVNS